MKKGRFVAIFYMLSLMAILMVSRVDAAENLNVDALESAMRTGNETVASSYYIDPAKKTQAKACD